MPDYSKITSKLENFILSTYNLKANGRIIEKPLNDQEICKGLEAADIKFGNNDGKTSIDELRRYLFIVSAWEEDYFHNKYTQKVIPELKRELAELSSLEGTLIVDPYEDQGNVVSEYTLVNATLLFLKDHLGQDTEVVVTDKKILELLKKHDYAELQKDTEQELYDFLYELSPLIIKKMTDKEKVVYLEKLVLSDKFLAVQYCGDESKVPHGVYGEQLPAEIINNLKSRRLAECTEITNLGIVMARALGLRASLVDVTYLTPLPLVDFGELDKRSKNIADEETKQRVLEYLAKNKEAIPNVRKHAFLIVWADDEPLHLDLAVNSANTTYEDLKKSFHQKDYKNWMISYELGDYFSNLHLFYEEAAKDLLDDRYAISDYPYLQKAFDLLQASYVLDPAKTDYDFYNILYILKATSELVDRSLKIYPFFVGQYGETTPLTYEYLFAGYFAYNKYNLKTILGYLDDFNEPKYFEEYLKARQNLKLVITEAGNRFFVPKDR